MQQKRKKLYLKSYNKKNNWFKFKKQRNRFFLRKLLKYKTYNFEKKISKIPKPHKFNYSLHIIVKQNNIFCNIFNLKTNKLVTSLSSGKIKIKVSKRKLKHVFKYILAIYIEKINKLKLKRLIINLIAPIKIRKKILKQLSSCLKKKSIVIKVSKKKCFNGCRPPKKVRKKRRKFRLFK